MKDAAFAKTEHAWYCHNCATRLAWFDLSGLHLPAELTRLDGDKDGLQRFGRGHGGQEHAPTRRLPIFVYCPACRAGQRIAS